MATLSAVTMGVLAAEPATNDNLLASSGTSQPVAGTSADSTVDDATLRRRAESTTVSRSQIRTAAKAESAARKDISVDKKARQLAKKLDDKVWTTDLLNLWDGPTDKADKLGVIDALKQVSVTGRKQLGRTQVVIDGQSRWVTSDYLSAKKPKPEPEPEAQPEVQAKSAGPGLGGACSNGTSAGGAGVNIQKVHEAVCANWPSISTYGTLRGGGGDHPLGRAVDIMVSGATGWAVAEFVRANAAALGVNYVIHAQNIWSVQRSGEGWRAMPDRGSSTANHYDHVHVSVY